MAIEVFDLERDAGLEEQILTTAAIAYCQPVMCQSTGFQTLDSLTPLMAERIKKQFAAASITNQPDLLPLTTVLATSGWNKNGDVTDVIEAWKARHTAEDKPWNLEHNCARIIGHITDSTVMDEDMQLVDDSITDLDKLPSKIHVVTNAVIYKMWHSDKKLQQEMDTLIEEIGRNEWFVSMESSFAGFDYAVKDETGRTVVVARNKETAFLTKYLRAYGGSGKYNGYQLGRLLRNIIYCGKGLVRKPANPESIIFDEVLDFDSRSSTKEIPENFEENIKVSENPVYSHVAQGSESQQTIVGEQDMKTIEQLTAELAERDATIASLKSTSDVQANTLSTVQASLAEAEKRNVELQEQVATANKTASETIATLNAEVASLKTSFASASEELGTLKAQAKRLERLAVVVSKLKSDEAEAQKLVEATFVLDDTAFASHVDFLQTAIASKKPAEAPGSLEDDPAEGRAQASTLEGAVPDDKGGAAVPETSRSEVARASISKFLKSQRGE